MKLSILAVASLCAALYGCAATSGEIVTSVIPVHEFADYSCDQLNAESQRIANRVVKLGGSIDQAATNDKLLTGVAIVLAWPAIGALGGTEQQERDYARIRGEYDAIHKAAAIKHCPAFGNAAT
jgi:hypothetical protein